MIDHFEIKTTRFDDCVAFYQSVLKPLAIELKFSDTSAAGFGLTREPNTRFLIEKSVAGANCHVAFSAPDVQAVNDFFANGISIGATSNGEPGIRKHYAPNYYAAFLLDPDGNNVEAVVYVQL